jgi:hypothetical protein
MQNNRVQETCFLPGWMFDSSYYGFAPKVRLWQAPFKKIQPPPAKILIGFSLGGNLALKWFLEGNSEKLILINPVIKPRSLAGLVLCHLRYLFADSVKGKVDWSGTISFKYLPRAAYSGVKIFNLNFWQTIEKCPREKVSLVFGEEDNFFASKEAKEILKTKGFKVTEVPQSGHH